MCKQTHTHTLAVVAALGLANLVLTSMKYWVRVLASWL